MVIDYLPEICLFSSSMFPTFVFQILVLSFTFSWCYLTSFAYFLQPQTSYISSTNYGGPCQMPFCSLFMSLQVISSIFCSFLISFYQLIIVTLPPRFSLAPILFLWQQSLTFQMVIWFITKHSHEYLPHKKQACYWSKVGDIIPLSSYLL